MFTKHTSNYLEVISTLYLNQKIENQMPLETSLTFIIKYQH